MRNQHLSPVYGLSLIRLSTGEDMTTWPGLLLHSHTLTWAFDPNAAQLDDLSEIQGLAQMAGLHPARDPFTPYLPRSRLWTFHLPDDDRPARLTTPAVVVQIGRPPRITADWWQLAVAHGGACRMLVAACVNLSGSPARAACQLHDAADDGRVFGATIGVEFFPTTPPGDG